MIDKSYINKLLEGVEVEYKTLGEVTCNITSKNKIKATNYSKSGLIPIIDQSSNFISAHTDNLVGVIKLDECIVFGDHTENIKYINFPFQQGADGIKILKVENNNTKYIYYCFNNFYVKELKYKRHWSNAKQLIIPIPPIHIQEEIVNTLDVFTKYTSELKAELKAELKVRINQYEYYRDKLLTFDDNEVEYKTLGEVLIRTTGTKITAKKMKELDKINGEVKILVVICKCLKFQYQQQINLKFLFPLFTFKMK